MEVRVSSHLGVRIDKSHELSRLKIVADFPISQAPRLSKALRGFGELDHEGFAWLDVGWIRAKSGLPDAGWNAKFEEMLQYANVHGWLRSEPAMIRSHVEWSDP